MKPSLLLWSMGTRKSPRWTKKTQKRNPKTITSVIKDKRKNASLLATTDHVGYALDIKHLILRSRVSLMATLRRFPCLSTQVCNTIPLFSSDNSHAGQYVVLIFYPLDFTFVCPTELLMFNEKQEEFQEARYEFQIKCVLIFRFASA